ncbi:hypothetical protein ACQUE6_13450 [Enterococcus casseliflavus]|nr:hypothetical protein [Enterococcus gallinarum]
MVSLIIGLFILGCLAGLKKILEVSEEDPDLYWWENIRNWINRH